MIGFFVADIGLGYEEANYIPLRDLWYIISAYDKKVNRESRERWEIARVQTGLLFNIQLESKDRVENKDLIPLPWDEPEPEMSDEEKRDLDRQRELLDETFNRIKK